MSLDFTTPVRLVSVNLSILCLYEFVFLFRNKDQQGKIRWRVLKNTQTSQQQKESRNKSLHELRERFGTTNTFNAKQFLDLNSEDQSSTKNTGQSGQKLAISRFNQTIQNAKLSQHSERPKSVSLATFQARSAIKNPSGQVFIKMDHSLIKETQNFINEANVTMNVSQINNFFGSRSRQHSAHKSQTTRKVLLTPQRQHLKNTPIKYEPYQQQNESIGFSPEKLTLLSSGYYKFNNNRVVPELYKQTKADRANMTMMNIQKDIMGMNRNHDGNEDMRKLQKSFGASRSMGRVLNRTLNVRDTFMNIQPAYGVVADEPTSEFRNKYQFEEFDFSEGKRTVDKDRTYFCKFDDMKRYTEEWLKTANMRGKK